MKIAALLVAAVVGLTAATDSKAVVIVFTDRSAWETAIGTVNTTQDFSGFPTVPLALGSTDFGLLNIEINGTSSGQNSIANFPNLSPNGSQAYFGEVRDTVLPSFVFDAPVLGFGAVWRNTGRNARLAVTIDAQLFRFQSLLFQGNGDGFLGFVSDTPFLRADFSKDETLFVNNIFGVDDISIGLAQPVVDPDPVDVAEPSMGAMMLFGILSFGTLILGRRRALAATKQLRGGKS